jgi:hypothetical protein
LEYENFKLYFQINFVPARQHTAFVFLVCIKAGLFPELKMKLLYSIFKMNLTFYPYTLKLKHKFVLSKHFCTAILSALSEMKLKGMNIINGRIKLPEGSGIGIMKK